MGVWEKKDKRFEEFLASLPSAKKKPAGKPIEVSAERVKQLLEEIKVPPLKAIREKK